MDDWIKLMREFGFPAAVAGFVLWRVDAALRCLAGEVRRLTEHLIAHGLTPPNGDGKG